MAGGSVVEKADDELVGGVRGLVGVIGVVALIGVLGLFNLWWLVFVVGVLISIFMHELGHYMTARWTGMKATQFFIGFGPRLWSFRKGETEYGVRALPLGAFVRIIGMNNMDEVPPEDESRTYRSKSYPRRMLVISAGSLMHMLIAIVLLFTVYVADGEITPTDGVEVRQVLVASPAATAGLRADDVIVAINGERLEQPEDLGTVVQASSAGETLDVVVLRDGARVAVPVVIAANADRSSPLYGKPYIGVSSSRAFETIDHSVPAAAVNAVIDIVPTSWEMTKGVVKVLNPVNIATHLAGTNEDLETRPTTLVGVTSVSDDVGDSAGFIGILFLLAILNVFVGVFNMFPLLPLDGGHAAIATYERLRERNGQRYHADVSKMMPFAMAVITMLMFLFMAGLYLDITQPVG
jgi:membrane-associated protease RseP (regulator of RpoE activity)